MREGRLVRGEVERLMGGRGGRLEGVEKEGKGGVGYKEGKGGVGYKEGKMGWVGRGGRWGGLEGGRCLIE